MGRFDEDVFGEVNRPDGSLVKREGVPQHSEEVRDVLDSRRISWQDYYRTGDDQLLISSGLVPEPNSG